jgi:hypothetical protein
VSAAIAARTLAVGRLATIGAAIGGALASLPAWVSSVLTLAVGWVGTQALGLVLETTYEALKEWNAQKGSCPDVPEWLRPIFGDRFFNRDPLVLDLDRGGVSLTSLGLSNAYFDLDGNGFAERVGWVTAGDGLLALDVNRNGRIDGGSELFGTARENGFTVLARYDDNNDGQITSADSVWDSLLIWRDANSDGASTAAELTSIAANDISTINLNARTGNLGSRAGNPLLAIGNYTDASGFGTEAIAVAFTSDQTNTRFLLPEGFEYDPEVFLLPNLRGYGELPDLWVAMSLDPVLKAMVQDLVASDYDEISDLVGEPYSIKQPDYYRYGFRQTGATTYHYRTTEFEDMLAR